MLAELIRQTNELEERRRKRTAEMVRCFDVSRDVSRDDQKMFRLVSFWKSYISFIYLLYIFYISRNNLDS